MTEQDDCCYVCLTDGIDEDTGEGALYLKCGHRVHYDCVIDSITDVISRRGIKINTNVATCGVCRRWLQHPLLKRRVTAIQELQNELTELHQADASVVAADTELSVFYRCTTCGDPFLGGSQACQPQQRAVHISDVRCPACHKGSEFWCEDHGATHIVYKCRFCCNQARYFCWGTTHLCAACHQPPMPRKPKKCESECAGTHPPNDGREHALGCSLCWVMQGAPEARGLL